MAFINDNFKLATLTIANLTTGGAIGIAAATVDIASSFLVNQTTAGQLLSLPSPTDAIAGDLVRIGNSGTASFTILGQTISVGEYAEFMWSGSAWFYVGDTRNAGAVVVVASVVVGNNTITHNLNMPTGSFSNVMMQAYNATGNEITFRRVFASDTANALVVNSTIALTNVRFHISPLA